MVLRKSGVICSVCLFVCLFGVFRPTREFFTHMETSPAGEGLQIFTFDRHSWPLSSEGSLTCHTYCDTGHPFIMVISEDPWHSHLLPSVWQWSCHYLFLRPRSVATGIRTPNLLHVRRHLLCKFLCFRAYIIKPPQLKAQAISPSLLGYPPPPCFNSLKLEKM